MKTKLTEVEKAARKQKRILAEAEANRKFKEEQAAYRAAAPTRMLALMARANALAISYEVKAIDCNETPRYMAMFKFPWADGSMSRADADYESVHTESDEWTFESVNIALRKLEDARDEAERQAQVRKDALAKVKNVLTEEEIKLLNVRTY